MPAVATGPMIRREIGDDHVCLLVFDRPESGANIFDAATLDELNEHLGFVENNGLLSGLIIASAKKSIFVAGSQEAGLGRWSRCTRETSRASAKKVARRKTQIGGASCREPGVAGDSPSKTTRKRRARTCLGNHQQNFVDFARPIAADGAG